MYVQCPCQCLRPVRVSAVVEQASVAPFCPQCISAWMYRIKQTKKKKIAQSGLEQLHLLEHN